MAMSGASALASSPRATTVVSKRAGVVDRRYCELFLVHRTHRGFIADVYNTFGLNNCPQRAWRAIDTAAVARAQHALLVVRNGPRYWLMNRIDKVQNGPRVIKNLGGLRMMSVATLVLGQLTTAPYSVHRVNRSTVFTYNRGQTVYELHGPNGAVWVMQSWSQQIDPTLNRAELSHLRSRLHLPTGWSYRTRTLTKPLRIVTVKTAAEVLQDNLGDSYSRL